MLTWKFMYTNSNRCLDTNAKETMRVLRWIVVVVVVMMVIIILIMMMVVVMMVMIMLLSSCCHWMDSKVRFTKWCYYSLRSGCPILCRTLSRNRVVLDAMTFGICYGSTAGWRMTIFIIMIACCGSWGRRATITRFFISSLIHAWRTTTCMYGTRCTPVNNTSQDKREQCSTKETNIHQIAVIQSLNSFW